MLNCNNAKWNNNIIGKLMDGYTELAEHHHAHSHHIKNETSFYILLIADTVISSFFVVDAYR